MWRRVALGLVAALFVAPAFAADVPRVVVPPPVVALPRAPVNLFAGPYIGLHGGWGWSDATSAYVGPTPPGPCGPAGTYGCPVDVDPQGAFVGGQAGWNFVTGGGLMI